MVAISALRAELILAMDAKIRRQLPRTTKRKSVLFTKFFGRTGNITDPYVENTPQIYREVFDVIHPTIQDRIQNLIRRLK